MAIHQASALFTGRGRFLFEITVDEAPGARLHGMGAMRTAAFITAAYGGGAAIRYSASGGWQTDTDLDLALTVNETDLYDNIPHMQFRWQIGPPEMRFYWTVHVAHAALTWFRASKGQCGVDPHLRIGRFIDLECLFQRWKPAMTSIVFSYDNLTANSKMAGTP